MKMSKARLRAECLPSGAAWSYVRVIVDGHIAGHVFACRWKHGARSICWVTQLVVDCTYRERGLATGLLTKLKRDSDSIYGTTSSHPAACRAVATALGGKNFVIGKIQSD